MNSVFVMRNYQGLGKCYQPHFFSADNTYPEEVGQLLAKHHGKFARVFSFMRGLLRSEHLCGINNMEAFERQECQATILRENSTIYIYCCDPYYDKAFTNRWREELALYRTPRLLFRNWTALNLLVLSNM